MSALTWIQWTDRTWNPVTGCTKVSPGCKNCYAEAVAERFWATQYPKNADGSARKFTDVRCHPERLDEPLRWRKPARVFVNSMSDLFHEDVPERFIGEVFATMCHPDCEKHTFQVLTKRPKRMHDFCAKLTWGKTDNGKPWGWIPPDNCVGVSWPFPNVHLGVSIENPEEAEWRIGWLQRTPAVVRFLSIEPLLERVDLDPVLLRDIDWVIVGGESGPRARPCNIEWIESILLQCRAAHVPIFVKQLGAKTDWSENGWSRLNDRHGGDPAEWPEHLRVREFPIGGANV
jgi:protein gp37